MQTETIHLTTCNSFQEVSATDRSQIIINAFVESCKKLDASIFESFMEEENVFEDKNKYLFLSGLKKMFDTYKDKNILFINVEVENGTCKGCNNGKAVKIFTVNGRGRFIIKDRFAYVIEQENGILVDIFRCNLFCAG